MSRLNSNQRFAHSRRIISGPRHQEDSSCIPQGRRSSACLLAVGGVLLLLGLSSFLKAAPVDLTPPKNALGYTDKDGYLRVVYKFGDLRFSDGFTLPIRFDFSSARVDEGSEFGWPGWHCGPFEAIADFYGGNEYVKVTLLCSKTLFLKRVADDPATYLSLDGAWTGKVSGEDFSVSREDGWDLQFHKKRVARLRTDSGLVIEWLRDGQGRLAAIREKDDPNSGMSLEWDHEKARVIGCAVEKKEALRFQYDEKGHLANVYPLPQPNPYRFIQKPGSLRITTPRGKNRLFEWNPQTGKLRSDGLNEYRVLVDKKDRSKGRRIVMTNAKGEQMSRQIDAGKGLTRLIYPSGREIATTRFAGDGPNVGKIRKMEEVLKGPDGQPRFVLLMSNTYSSRGELLERLWRGNPIQYKLYHEGKVEPALLPKASVEYPILEEQNTEMEELRKISYDFEESRHTSTAVNGKIALEIKYDSRGREILFELPGRFRRTARYSETGIESIKLDLLIERTSSRRFPFVGEDDPSISPTLVVESRFDAQGRLNFRRLLNQSCHYLFFDAQGRTSRRETIASDGKTKVESDFYVHKPGSKEVFVIRENHLNGKKTYLQMVEHQTGRISVIPASETRVRNHE